MFLRWKGNPQKRRKRWRSKKTWKGGGDSDTDKTRLEGGKRCKYVWKAKNQIFPMLSCKREEIGGAVSVS